MPGACTGGAKSIRGKAGRSPEALEPTGWWQPDAAGAVVQQSLQLSLSQQRGLADRFSHPRLAELASRGSEAAKRQRSGSPLTPA